MFSSKVVLHHTGLTVVDAMYDYVSAMCYNADCWAMQTVVKPANADDRNKEDLNDVRKEIS